MHPRTRLAWAVAFFGILTSNVTSSSSYKFLGIGYNLLKANPDGGEQSSGGIDPGLLYTRKIFDLSHPEAVQSESRQSCSKVTKNSIFFDEKSYQEKLKDSVAVKGDATALIAGFAFTLSRRFQEAKKETRMERKVFQDEVSICNLGRQRFAEELAQAYSFPVTRNFAASVCFLRPDYEKRKIQYMMFLDSWGTHVTVEVELGTKNITRKETTLSNFVNHVATTSAADVSIGGSYQGFSGSLKVDYESFKTSSAFQSKFGEYSTTLRAGTETLPEPIGLHLEPIYAAMDSPFWQNTSNLLSSRVCTKEALNHLHKIKENLKQALEEYVTFKKAPLPSDLELKIPLAWPRGTYAVYKPEKGCPKGNFTWYEGSVTQDMEDSFTENHFSNSLHLAGTFVPKSDITTSFCIKGKVEMTKYDIDWPRGDYCLAKYGECPTGFTEGWLLWDDEDDNNYNSHEGFLPDGVFNQNTLIYYCCRNDSLPTVDVILPNDSPFFLLRHSRSCQQVVGMHVAEEFIYYDEEWWWFSSGNQKAGGYHPYDDGDPENHQIHFCYYTPLTGRP